MFVLIIFGTLNFIISVWVITI